MLKKILSPKVCADCRLCCKFDCTDTWELPVISKETAKAVMENKPETRFIPIHDEMTFKAPPLSGDELFSCPALTDSGCGLQEHHKPFDCKIWPFRIMHDEKGNRFITVSELCEGIKSFPDNELQNFLKEENLSTIIFDFAKTHPSHVKPLTDGYRILIKEV
jgi:Fe-S-cluster containining protein